MNHNRFEWLKGVLCFLFVSIFQSEGLCGATTCVSVRAVTRWAGGASV